MLTGTGSDKVMGNDYELTLDGKIDKLVGSLGELYLSGKGGDWEKEYDWISQTIIEGQWYDGLEYLFKSAIEMKSLLLECKSQLETLKDNRTSGKGNVSRMSSCNCKEEKEVEEEVVDDEEIEIELLKDLSIEKEVEEEVIDEEEIEIELLKELSCGTTDLIKLTDTHQPLETCVTGNRNRDNRIRNVHAMRRKNNLMMFGLWEAKDTYDSEVAAVLDYLGVVTQEYSIEIRRRKALSDGKVILKVIFDNPQPVIDSLLAAKKLGSYKETVFLANDMTYDERALQRRLVIQLKNRIESQPQYHWAIEDYEVVSYGLRSLRSRLRSLSGSTDEGTTSGSTSSSMNFEPSRQFKLLEP